MRLHRFYTPFLDLIAARPGSRLSLNTEHSTVHDTDYKGMFHQWKDVFGYTAGSQVLLFDGKGGEVLVMIEDLGFSRAELVVIENRERTEGAPGITGTWLFQSILKGENFDWVIQKTTELGVDHIVPILSDRTIKKDLNMTRSKKIAIEAAEQSGRKTIPTIHKPIKLEDAIEEFENVGGKLFVCTGKGKPWGEIKDVAKLAVSGTDMAGVSSNATAGAYAIGFAVGPEGGWADREEMYFKRHKFTQVSLGKNILRAETAAVAVITLAKIA